MANLTPVQYGPWALIAGSSKGIGLAFGHEVAAAGLNLIHLAWRTGPASITLHPDGNIARIRK